MSTSLDPTGEVLLAVLPWDPEWYPSSWHKCILQAAALLLLADTCRRNPLCVWLVFSSLPVKAVQLHSGAASFRKEVLLPPVHVCASEHFDFLPNT